jgi:CBS domain-containing protein
MRRVNIRAAFAGEPSFASEASGYDESDEAVVLEVRGGELYVIVPQGTAEEAILDRAGTVRGTLHLENERVLTFEIQDGAVGAFFEHEDANLHSRRQEGSGLFAVSPASSSPGQARARDLMRTDVVAAAPDTPVEALAALLSFHHISGVPVVADGRLVGIVSQADVIARQGRTAGDIMTREVAVVGEDTPLATVITLLTQRHIRRVPVVRGDRLVGIISRGDVMRWVAGQRVSSSPS